jgi:hypothetical protein
LRSPSALTDVFAARPGERASPKDISIQEATQQIGKYLVSSSTRRADGGRYAAALSIRSGRGSMTHDRVMRFEPTFRSRGQALRFAWAQARAWLDAQACASLAEGA